MKSIQSIPEALKAMAEVKESVGAIEEFFERIFQGDSAKQSTPPKAGVNGTASMPSAFVDRIAAILGDQTKPMRPKAATKEYARRGWPLPGKGGADALYNNVIGALLYLRKHKKIVERNDDGYFLKGSRAAQE